MMDKPWQSTLILFWVVSAVTFLWSFLRQKEWTILTVKPFDKATFKLLGAITLSFALLFAASLTAGMTMAWGALYFVPAFLITFALERLDFQPWQRGILLLMLSVGASTLLPDVKANGFIALIAGLVVAKLTTSLIFVEKTVLEDVIPSLVWLATVIWVRDSTYPVVQEELILGVLSTSMFLRWVQRPLMHEDAAYLKRIMLSLVGGLTFLCIVTKVINAYSYPKMAFLVGISYLFGFLLQTMDRSKDEPSLKGFKQLVLIGILTVAASRTYGMEGLLVAAAAMPVVAGRSAACLAAAFWCGRVICQSYVAQYDPNVTGVNLTHTYTTAALYAGFLSMCILPLFLRDFRSKSQFLIVCLFLSISLPMGANYFLHPEPTASFLIACTVAAILMVIMSKSFNLLQEESESLILLPALFGSTACMSNELLAFGEQATNHDRMWAIALMVTAIVLLTIAAAFSSRLNKIRVVAKSGDA